MATKYKPITQNNDVATTRTLLHEAIPLTGTIVSGTYADGNIKNYSHGMFQSVYDYPYLSSSANHIYDIAIGYSSKSSLSSSANKQNDKKINMYNQMAQVLVGHDLTGAILQFDRAGDTTDVGTKMNEVIFLNFSRLLTKDEIKKEAFTLTFLTGGTPGARAVGVGGSEKVISDYGATTTYKTNSPAGEYAILYSGSAAVANTGVGLVYYQAGIAVLSASIFDKRHTGLAVPQFGPPSGGEDTSSISKVFTAANITASCDGVRNAWKNLSFNNSTELNSTIYFCRVNHNEFNYSSNPTYLSASQIRVKSKRTDAPVSYITTVGLYSADNILMAVAKLSEPLKKTPSNEFTLRVRLDY
tara:strand:+ start:69 stop:1139 length:1071 start_codon:yes stop_codon:yes gene_type:complete